MTWQQPLTTQSYWGELELSQLWSSTGGYLGITSLRNKMADEIQCDKCNFDTQEANYSNFTHQVTYLLVGGPPRTPGNRPGSISSWSLETWEPMQSPWHWVAYLEHIGDVFWQDIRIHISTCAWSLLPWAACDHWSHPWHIMVNNFSHS